MTATNPKCRFCQRTIYPWQGEELISYNGHSYHGVCFFKWLMGRRGQLEEKLQKKGLTESEREELKELEALGQP
ncbi:MAG: hypothetical protein JRD89_04860 [Deltaproteobacteria bacterium]|nr:hypothetical protein [Deltaproteobacteria bacterium]